MIKATGLMKLHTRIRHNAPCPLQWTVTDLDLLFTLVLCRRFRAEVNFEFLIRKKVQYKFLFQFLYGNPQIIYSNNKTTMFAQKQQLQHRVQVSITNNNCSTGLPDLIIRAIIFHLEIQIISHDGVPLVSHT